MRRPLLRCMLLLSLANTESHNFTAEVLLRQAADQWDVRAASAAAHRWMQQQGIPVGGLRVADGSGLIAQQPCVESDHRGVVDADGSTSLCRLLPSIDGDCWTARNAAQLLHWFTNPRQVLGENRNHQWGALDFWNSPNQRRSALREHDLKWCQPTERNDRPDPEDRL